MRHLPSPSCARTHATHLRLDMGPHLKLGLACRWLSWDYPGMTQIGHVAFVRYERIEPVRLATRLVNAVITSSIMRASWPL